MLVKYPDPILTTALEDFDFFNTPQTPLEIATKLMTVMNDCSAVGLAANQIGLPHRVFVMRGHPENFVCFNPRIVHRGAEQSSMEEACLSFPGVTVKIKRPTEIRVRFQAPSGAVVTQKFEGLTARVFQHELDHLDGVLFFNRAGRYHREKALKGFYNVK